MERENDVTEAVAIVARGLSASEFDRVRYIIMSDSVLNDPDLARRIENAFLHTSGMVHPACMLPRSPISTGMITASAPDS
jgi:methyl coenzyme M reductase gamma subunit